MSASDTLFARWRQRRKKHRRRAAQKVASTSAPDQGADALAYFDLLLKDLALGSRVQEVGSDAFWKAWDRAVQGKYEAEAVFRLNKVLLWDGLADHFRQRAHEQLARTHELRGELQDAISHYEVVADFAEDPLDAIRTLAEINERLGNISEARRYYERAYARCATLPNLQKKMTRLRRSTQTPWKAKTPSQSAALSRSRQDRYQLVKPLGQGASASVFLASDQELGREVAVKVLHPHLAVRKQADACAKFFEEARLAASMRHPHVIAILDLDEAQHRIVMELCQGGTLRQELRRSERIPLPLALKYHGQLLSALVAAHRQDISHRDLKPNNLLFRSPPERPGEEIVLGDFGTAHLPNVSGKTSQDLTRDIGAKPIAALKAAEDVGGTFAYMAPEQRRGRASPASDLYASGVVLYEMLTGSRPWTDESWLAEDRRDDDCRIAGSLGDCSPDFLASLNSHLASLTHVEPRKRPNAADCLVDAERLYACYLATSVI